MSSLKQQILSLTAITGIYLGVLGLFFREQFVSWNILSVGIAFVVFLLSALITTTGSASNGESNAQRFLVGTTVQMLAALLYIVIARFAVTAHFKGMVIHFMILFFVFLAVQSILLVRRVRKA